MPNTREKLIELITDRENDLVRKIAWFTDTYRIKEVADHLIANGVTFATDNNVGHKWISVKDRLPDKNGEYLCRWINKSVSDAEYESTFGSFGYWFDFWEDEYKDWISYEGITHWMPLPEPPKGE